MAILAGTTHEELQAKFSVSLQQMAYLLLGLMDDVPEDKRAFVVGLCRDSFRVELGDARGRAN